VFTHFERSRLYGRAVRPRGLRPRSRRIGSLADEPYPLVTSSLSEGMDATLSRGE